MMKKKNSEKEKKRARNQTQQHQHINKTKNILLQFGSPANPKKTNQKNNNSTTTIQFMSYQQLNNPKITSTNHQNSSQDNFRSATTKIIGTKYELGLKKTKPENQHAIHHLAQSTASNHNAKPTSWNTKIHLQEKWSTNAPNLP